MLPPSTLCKTKIGMQHPVAAALRIATTATPTPENKCRIECQNIICSPKPTPKGCRGREEVATVGGYAIPAGTVYCVCCVCQPKCMSMKISGVRYANMQQKCILYYVKGNLSELGLALLCQICQMLWQCLLQGGCPQTHTHSHTTHTDKQLQFNAFVLVAFGIRFRYSLIASSLWVNMFLSGRKPARIQKSEAHFFTWNRWWFLKNKINKYYF